MAVLSGNITSAATSLSGGMNLKATEWGLISGTLSNQTDLQNALNAKQNSITTENKLSASLVSGLATVATSGSYNDLSNKPSINNATITVKKNGTLVQSFTTNQSTDQDINIVVPTKTSDIEKDDVYTQGQTDSLLTAKLDKERTTSSGTYEFTLANSAATITATSTDETDSSMLSVKKDEIGLAVLADDLTNISGLIVDDSGLSFTRGDGSILEITDNGIELNGTITGTNNIQPKLTAGTNITIENNVISAADGGNVDDVKVNGTSVVTNKVANIDLTGKEDNTNKVTSISSASTDTQYPSAKCMYDLIGNLDSLLEALL